LETIQRVARFEAGQVQQVGGRSSLVLPDGIRAMLGLGEFLPGVPGSTNQESGYLLLPKDAIGARAGLVVADIVDTARAPAALQPAPMSAPGVLGAAQLLGRLTLVVDPIALSTAWEDGQ
jgi:chemotaxis protein histidine kinase CheA